MCCVLAFIVGFAMLGALTFLPTFMQFVDGVSATAEVTGASVENMGLIATGDADLAIGLADTVQQAQTGTGRFEGQQLEMVRGVASLYANMVQIVTLADSGITSLEDMRGRRISILSASHLQQLRCL